MIEIKYKAIHKNGGDMQDHKEVMRILYNEACGVFPNAHSYHIMRFTGLKDRKGKDAYFDDLVILRDGYGGKDARYKIDIDYIGSPFFIRLTEPFKDAKIPFKDYFTPNDISDFEIVGNIHIDNN